MGNVHRLRVLGLGALLLVAPACGPLFSVVPLGRAPQAAATSGGVTVTVLAEQWRGSPSDLADRVTPVAVVLQNAGPQSVAVSLADFELWDDRNEGGVALNPFYYAIADGTPPELLDVERGPKLAFRGWGPRVRIGPPRYVPSPRRVWVGAPRVVVRPTRGWGPRWGPHFHVAGGLRRFYGPSVIYWGGAWVGPTASTWEGGYSAPEVLAYALPEGVLQPGGEVRGFVYFSRLTSDQTRELRLRYRPRDAATGAVAPQVEIRLEVLRN